MQILSFFYLCCCFPDMEIIDTGRLPQNKGIYENQDFS